MPTQQQIFEQYVNSLPASQKEFWLSKDPDAALAQFFDPTKAAGTQREAIVNIALAAPPPPSSVGLFSSGQSNTSTPPAILNNALSQQQLFNQYVSSLPAAEQNFWLSKDPTTALSQFFDPARYAGTAREGYINLATTGPEAPSNLQINSPAPTASQTHLMASNLDIPLYHGLLSEGTLTSDELRQLNEFRDAGYMDLFYGENYNEANDETGVFNIDNWSGGQLSEYDRNGRGDMTTNKAEIVRSRLRQLFPFASQEELDAAAYRAFYDPVSRGYLDSNVNGNAMSDLYQNMTDEQRIAGMGREAGHPYYYGYTPNATIRVIADQLGGLSDYQQEYLNRIDQTELPRWIDGRSDIHASEEENPLAGVGPLLAIASMFIPGMQGFAGSIGGLFGATGTAATALGTGIIRTATGLMAGEDFDDAVSAGVMSGGLNFAGSELLGTIASSAFSGAPDTNAFIEGVNNLVDSGAITQDQAMEAMQAWNNATSNGDWGNFLTDLENGYVDLPGGGNVDFSSGTITNPNVDNWSNDLTPPTNTTIPPVPPITPTTTTPTTTTPTTTTPTTTTPTTTTTTPTTSTNPSGTPVTPTTPTTTTPTTTTPFDWSSPSTWPWSTITSGVTGALGSYLNSEQSAEAAQAVADAQVQAAQIAADAARFRPVGVTTRFGQSQFGFDDQGRLTSAGYTLNPNLVAQQDQLMTAANSNLNQAIGAQEATAPMRDAAQTMFGLGNSYLSTTPEEQAQRYYDEQQALLSATRERDLASLQNRLQQQGRLGLAVGGTSNGMMAANPEMEAYYNANRQQDLGLAARATQGGMDYANFGAGMVGAGGDMLRNRYQTQVAASTPFMNSMQNMQYLEGLGQNAMTQGMQLGSTATAANAASGGLLAQGMINSAQTMQPSNSYSPWGALLSGASNSLTQYQQQQQQQQSQQQQQDFYNAMLARMAL